MSMMHTDMAYCLCSHSMARCLPEPKRSLAVQLQLSLPDPLLRRGGKRGAVGITNATAALDALQRAQVTNNGHQT